MSEQFPRRPSSELSLPNVGSTEEVHIQQIPLTAFENKVVHEETQKPINARVLLGMACFFQLVTARSHLDLIEINENHK